MSSSSLTCTASASLFWVCWIRKTIRKVTMVVPVLIMSCHVSLYSKMGPVRAQIATMPAAIVKAAGRPAARDVFFANLTNHEVEFIPGSGEVDRYTPERLEIRGGPGMEPDRLASLCNPRRALRLTFFFADFSQSLELHALQEARVRRSDGSGSHPRSSNRRRSSSCATSPPVR